MEKKSRWAFIVIIVLLVLLLILGLFFYTKTCSTLACFNTNLEKCTKAKFINDAADSTWQYSIKGVSNDQCVVEVTLLVVKEGNLELANLEGQKMSCYLNIGEVADPKDNLQKCHGELREGIQNLLIEKLHAYILENIGQIGKELQQVV